MGKIELALILKRPKTAQNHASRPGFTCEHTCEWTGLDASKRQKGLITLSLQFQSRKTDQIQPTNAANRLR